MQVVKIFSDDDNTSSDLEYSWSQADIEGWVSLLSWKVCFSNICDALLLSSSFQI